MIDIPPHIQAQMLRTLREIDPNQHHMHIDSQAAQYGAIALLGSFTQILALRPDGSFWKFDPEFDEPLTPLEPEYEISALVWGCERYSWLSELLPPRPTNAKQCTFCEGIGWITHIGVTTTKRALPCEQCQGLGWQGQISDRHSSVERRWWQFWK